MQDIINYYNQFDEWGRLDREPIEFQVNWHYIKKYLPPKSRLLDNGAGPGKYSIKLAKEGFNVTLTDLTPKLVEIAKVKAKELELEKQFDGFYEADARVLNMFNDECFDASLMLGPMYHLQEEKDRIMAVNELHRVTKRNGIVFVAFMPRIRHVFTSLLNPDRWKPNNNMDAIIEFSKSGCFNHSDERRFTGAYYFNIEEITPFMEKSGFETLEFIGSNIGAILDESSWTFWKSQGKKEVEKLLQFIIERAADPYTLGISTHLLYIERKK